MYCAREQKDCSKNFPTRLCAFDIYFFSVSIFPFISAVFVTSFFSLLLTAQACHITFYIRLSPYFPPLLRLLSCSRFNFFN